MQTDRQTDRLQQTDKTKKPKLGEDLDSGSQQWLMALNTERERE